MKTVAGGELFRPGTGVWEVIAGYDTEKYKKGDVVASFENYSDAQACATAHGLNCDRIVWDELQEMRRRKWWWEFWK